MLIQNFVFQEGGAADFINNTKGHKLEHLLLGLRIQDTISEVIFDLMFSLSVDSFFFFFFKSDLILQLIFVFTHKLPNVD